jgi:hypothetical protein
MGEEKPPKVVVAPKFEDSKSPSFMYVFSTGVLGTLDPNDGRMTFFLDRIEPETVSDPPGASRIKKVVRELQVEVHMTPTQFKSIALWMIKNVEEYEKMFGTIPMEPKKKQPSSAMVT